MLKPLHTRTGEVHVLERCSLGPDLAVSRKIFLLNNGILSTKIFVGGGEMIFSMKLFTGSFERKQDKIVYIISV